MSTKTHVSIIGSATCQIGPILGHDGDECRANDTGDGILCYACGRHYPKFGPEILNIMRALVSANATGSWMQAPQVDKGSAIASDPDSPEFAAACLSGYDPLTNDTVRLRVAYGRYGFERVSLRYDSEDLKSAAAAEQEIGQDFNAFAWRAPESIERAAIALAQLGFRVTNAPTDGLLKTIIMVKGRRIVAGKPALSGIAVELTWQVD